MKFGPAAAAGQVCQRRSLSATALNVRRLELSYGRRGRGRRFGSPGQQGSDAARGESNDEHYDTRGFHTNNFLHHAATRYVVATATPSPDRYVVA